MSTFVPFVPSAQSPFSFQATLAGGQQYNVVITWNIGAPRYYLNVYDVANNPVVTRGLVPCGPTLDAAFTWANGVASAQAQTPHQIPIGDAADIRITNTDTGFDGEYQALAVDPYTLTYPLPTNPEQPSPISGTINSDIDLLEGYGIGSLYFHSDTSQFEF